MATQQVGVISAKVAALLCREDIKGSPVYLGESNIVHMKQAHPADYAKYGDCISDILKEPDYVGVNPKDDSIEYVKEYLIDHKYVKVAVRVSTAGRYFARSLYVLNSNRVKNFIAKGTLKKLDNL